MKRLLAILGVVAVVAAMWFAAYLERGPVYLERDATGHATRYAPNWYFSRERRALRSLGRATHVEILSLQPAWEGEAHFASRFGAKANPDMACGDRCIDRHAIVGRFDVPAGDRGEVAKILGGWLADRPGDPNADACAATFHHAISWREGGHRYDVLLCFGCGHYSVLIDGDWPLERERNAARTPGAPSITTWLRAAGIRHFDNAADAWVPGRDEVPVARTVAGEARTSSGVARMLAALPHATGMEAYVIEETPTPAGPEGALDAAPPPGETWSLACAREPCPGPQQLVGEKVDDWHAKRIAAVLALWLAHAPTKAATCPPVYHHVVRFSADGHAYHVQLDYGCGKYAIHEDGDEIASGAVVVPGGLDVINAAVETHGLQGWQPPSP